MVLSLGQGAVGGGMNHFSDSSSLPYFHPDALASHVHYSKRYGVLLSHESFGH